MRRRSIFTGHTGDGGDSGTIKYILEEKKILLHRLIMKKKAGTLTAAMIDNMLFTLTYEGGQTDEIVNVSGTQLNELQKALGMVSADSSSIFEIAFEMFGMKGVMETYSTSLNFLVQGPATKDAMGNMVPGKKIVSMTVEIKYSGATAAQVTFIGDIDDASNDGPGAIPRIKQFVTPSIAASTQADQEYTSLPAGKQSRFYRFLGLTPAAGTISLVKLSYDSGDYHYHDAAVEAQMQTEGQRVPGAYFGTIIDFSQEGISEPLDTGKYGKPTLKIAQSNAAQVTGVLATFGF